MTRKDQIEQVAKAAEKHLQATDVWDAAEAWRRLVIAMDAMCEPEATPPRFCHLLDAIWCAATNEESKREA